MNAIAAAGKTMPTRGTKMEGRKEAAIGDFLSLSTVLEATQHPTGTKEPHDQTTVKW